MGILGASNPVFAWPMAIAGGWATTKARAKASVQATQQAQAAEQAQQAEPVLPVFDPSEHKEEMRSLVILLDHAEQAQHGGDENAMGEAAAQIDSILGQAEEAFPGSSEVFMEKAEESKGLLDWGRAAGGDPDKVLDAAVSGGQMAVLKIPEVKQGISSQHGEAFYRSLAFQAKSMNDLEEARRLGGPENERKAQEIENSMRIVEATRTYGSGGEQELVSGAFQKLEDGSTRSVVDVNNIPSDGDPTSWIQKSGMLAEGEDVNKFAREASGGIAADDQAFLESFSSRYSGSGTAPPENPKDVADFMELSRRAAGKALLDGRLVDYAELTSRASGVAESVQGVQGMEGVPHLDSFRNATEKLPEFKEVSFEHALVQKAKKVLPSAVRVPPGGAYNYGGPRDSDKDDGTWLKNDPKARASWEMAKAIGMEWSPSPDMFEDGEIPQHVKQRWRSETEKPYELERAERILAGETFIGSGDVDPRARGYQGMNKAFEPGDDIGPDTELTEAKGLYGEPEWIAKQDDKGWDEEASKAGVGSGTLRNYLRANEDQWKEYSRNMERTHATMVASAYEGGKAEYGGVSDAATAMASTLQNKRMSMVMGGRAMESRGDTAGAAAARRQVAMFDLAADKNIKSGKWGVDTESLRKAAPGSATRQDHMAGIAADMSGKLSKNLDSFGEEMAKAFESPEKLMAFSGKYGIGSEELLKVVDPDGNAPGTDPLASAVRGKFVEENPERAAEMGIAAPATPTATPPPGEGADEPPPNPTAEPGATSGPGSELPPQGQPEPPSPETPEAPVDPAAPPAPGQPPTQPNATNATNPTNPAAAPVQDPSQDPGATDPFAAEPNGPAQVAPAAGQPAGSNPYQNPGQPQPQQPVPKDPSVPAGSLLDRSRSARTGSASGQPVSRPVSPISSTGPSQPLPGTTTADSNAAAQEAIAKGFGGSSLPGMMPEGGVNVTKDYGPPPGSGPENAMGNPGGGLAAFASGGRVRIGQTTTPGADFMGIEGKVTQGAPPAGAFRSQPANAKPVRKTQSLRSVEWNLPSDIGVDPARERVKRFQEEMNRDMRGSNIFKKILIGGLIKPAGEAVGSVGVGNQEWRRGNRSDAMKLYGHAGLKGGEVALNLSVATGMGGLARAAGKGAISGGKWLAARQAAKATGQRLAASPFKPVAARTTGIRLGSDPAKAVVARTTAGEATGKSLALKSPGIAKVAPTPASGKVFRELKPEDARLVAPRSEAAKRRTAEWLRERQARATANSKPQNIPPIADRIRAGRPLKPEDARLVPKAVVARTTAGEAGSMPSRLGRLSSPSAGGPAPKFQPPAPKAPDPSFWGRNRTFTKKGPPKKKFLGMTGGGWAGSSAVGLAHGITLAGGHEFWSPKNETITSSKVRGRSHVEFDEKGGAFGKGTYKSYNQ